MSGTTNTPDPGDGTSRRTVLRGAAVGGAALWVVPAVQAVDMSAASAETASPADRPTPKGAAAYAGPSHGLVAFDLAGVRHVVKVDESGSRGPVPVQAKSPDAEFLRGVYGTDATWQDGSAALLAGGRLLPAVNGVVVALYADVPTSATSLRGWTVNGRLSSTPLTPVTQVRGQDYRGAVITGNRVTFAL